MQLAKLLWLSALSLPSTLLHWWRKDYQDSRIIFEQNGAIRALSGKTLTLGQSDSSISIAAPISSAQNITVAKALPKLILDSPASDDNWTSQGAQISLGESGDGGSAALHITYVGNGYGYIGMGTLPATGIPPFSAIRFL